MYIKYSVLNELLKMYKVKLTAETNFLKFFRQLVMLRLWKLDAITVENYDCEYCSPILLEIGILNDNGERFFEFRINQNLYHLLRYYYQKSRATILFS